MKRPHSWPTLPHLSFAGTRLNWSIMRLIVTLCLACLTTLAATGSAAAAGQPNVVVFLADDLGYSDLGCYGSEIATPNLDALAKGGLRFSDFYNTARCCP